MAKDTTLTVFEGAEVELKNIEVVPYGLKFNADVSREEWGTAFQKLNHVNTVYQWYLGDLVAQADWQWKGEMYDYMMEVTGLEYGYLRQLASIATTFPQDVRKFIYENVRLNEQPTKLSNTHFAVAQSLMNKDPEQAVNFLVRAGREGWTVATLREEIARWKNNGKAVVKDVDEDVVAFKESTKKFFPKLMNLVEVRGYDSETEFLEELKYAVEMRLAALEEDEEE